MLPMEEGWFAQCVAANQLPTPNNQFPEPSDLHEHLHLGDVANKVTIPPQMPPPSIGTRDSCLGPRVSQLENRLSLVCKAFHSQLNPLRCLHGRYHQWRRYCSL